MQFKSITKTFGAEIVGLDPGKPLSAEDQETLRAALRQYNLLLVRGVDLDPTQQSQFSTVIGPTAPLPPGPPPEAPGIMYVSNTRDDGILPNGELAFHQDCLFDVEPLRVLMLYGVEIPGSGGGTKFRSCMDIYSQLDDALRAKAESVRCLHLFDFESVAVKPPTDGAAAWDADLADQKYSPFSLETASPNSPRTWQPLIWRNPADCEPVVWCNHSTTVAFEGIDYEGGHALLGEIMDRAEAVEEYLHEWRPGDLLLWNNLTLQHARTPFDRNEKRSLRRTMIM
jgi:taurine dioxygenase